jgi:hypothetical protein
MKVHFSSPLGVHVTNTYGADYDRTSVDADSFNCDVCGNPIPGGFRGFELFWSCRTCTNGWDVCASCSNCKSTAKTKKRKLPGHQHQLTAIDRAAEVLWANTPARGSDNDGNPTNEHDGAPQHPEAASTEPAHVGAFQKADASVIASRKTVQARRTSTPSGPVPSRAVEEQTPAVDVKASSDSPSQVTSERLAQLLVPSLRSDGDLDSSRPSKKRKLTAGEEEAGESAACDPPRVISCSAEPAWTAPL